LARQPERKADADPEPNARLAEIIRRHDCRSLTGRFFNRSETAISPPASDPRKAGWDRKRLHIISIEARRSKLKS
jgi:hypothetical protein